MTDHKDFIKNLILKAEKAGATDADAIYLESTSVGVQVRNGQVEELERSESKTVGLRVLVNKRVSTVSTTDLQQQNMEKLVEHAISMAKILPEDPYAELPAPSEKNYIEPQKLDLYDPTEQSTKQMIEQAKAVETAAITIK